MELIDKIFLDKADVEKPLDIVVGMAFTQHYSDRIYVEYIRKDALLEWAENEKRWREHSRDEYYKSAIVVLSDLIDKLKTL